MEFGKSSNKTVGPSFGGSRSASNAGKTLRSTSPFVVITRVILLFSLFFIIYLGYRLISLQRIDKVYVCVEATIQTISGLDEYASDPEGITVENAELLSLAADEVIESITKNRDCLKSIKGADTLVSTCSLFEDKAVEYSQAVKVVSIKAANGEDTYDDQDELTTTYQAYESALTACEEAISDGVKKISW